jgi:hypothetical protein
VKVLVLALVAALALASASAAAAAPAAKSPPTYDDVFGDAKLELAHRQVDKAEVPARTEADRVALAVAATCWYQRVQLSNNGWWGSWTLWQTNYWCGTGVNGVITYRSTNQGQSSTGFCSPTAPAQSYAVNGYVGYWFVDLKTQGSFNCSIAGIGYNGSPWFVVRYTSWGSVTPYAWDS